MKISRWFEKIIKIDFENCERGVTGVAKSLNLGFIVFTLPLIILFLFINPLISALSLIPLTGYVLSIWLLDKGKSLAGRLVLPINLEVSILLLAGIVKNLEQHMQGFNYLLLVAAIVPFLIFTLDELVYIILILTADFLVLLFSDRIVAYLHGFFTVELDHNLLLDLDKLLLVESFFALIFVSYIYRKHVSMYMRKLRENIAVLSEYQEDLKQKNEQLRSRNELIHKITSAAGDAVIVTAGKNAIIYWNKKAEEIFGYGLDEVLGRNPHEFMVLPHKREKANKHLERFEHHGECKMVGTTVEGKAMTKTGKILDIELSMSAIDVDNSRYVLAIVRDVTERNRRNRLLMQKNRQLELLTKDLTDSMRYARIIQNALLRHTMADRILNRFFAEHFIFFKPLQIVSGDFYYVRETENYIIVGVGDCTGHGIPGAFMTMITVSVLNEIIGYRSTLKPNEILAKLSFHLRRSLMTSDSQFHDSVELSLVSYEKRTGTLWYAGANLPLYYISNGELTEIKPDKQPVADKYRKKQIFTLHKIKPVKGDMFFMSTDGFYSQFGGQHNKKYSRKRFKELLVNLSRYTLSEAQKRLETEFYHWKQATDQTDDVLVMGIRF